ncbi:hypothetical protein CR513_59020, partial [Mucuna pruriens]
MSLSMQRRKNILAFVCFEVDLFLYLYPRKLGGQSCPPSDYERLIYMGDGDKVAIEAIGTFRLILKIDFHLDLVETHINLVIHVHLEIIKSVSYDSNIVHYMSLIDNLYMLDIECFYNKI